MNWKDKRSQTIKGVTMGNCKISRLLFADDLVLLSSTETGLHSAANTFSAACDNAEMKINTTKTEVLSRNHDQCSLQGRGASLKQVKKFKDFEVVFISDGR